jgi:hypothetical protein
MQQIVKNYIEAYNNFDISGMLADLAANVEFNNIVNGEVTLTLTGIEDFKTQAASAATFFTVRHQTITEIKAEERKVSVAIAYKAVLAKDLSDTLKKGDELILNGSSIFYFDQYQKIIRIDDIS